MWWVTQLVLVLAPTCVRVIIAENFDGRGEANDGTEAGLKTLSPIHKILEGLNDANQNITKLHTDEEFEDSDKPQTTSEASGLHNAKKKITVGELLHALFQKEKQGREKKPADNNDKERRENNQNEVDLFLGANNDDTKFPDIKHNNMFESIGNNKKSNNSVIIINLGDVQGNELTFLNGLDPRKGFIYVVQPGGQPQLHPLNQIHLFSQTDVPKYVVLFGNIQTHLFGNSDLQYLNTMLANSVAIPIPPSVGVLHNVPRALLPLFNLLPNLGVHVINVVPNAWTNEMFPKQPHVHNHEIPIINIYPNIGKPMSLGADVLTPFPSDEIQENVNIPDFIKPWINRINNVTEKPVRTTSNVPDISKNWLDVLQRLPGMSNLDKGTSKANVDINSLLATLGIKGSNSQQSVTTTNVPDISNNWLDVLQRLPGMNNPDKETSKSNVDFSNLLAALGMKGSDSQQSDIRAKSVSRSIIPNNGVSAPIKSISSNEDNVGLTNNNDLFLTLIKLIIENKDKTKSIADEQPTLVSKSELPKSSDSSLIKLLVDLIDKKSNGVSKSEDKVVVDNGSSNEGLTEKLLQLLGRKPNDVGTSDREPKEKKANLKHSQILIELLSGNLNILRNGNDNTEDDRSKTSEKEIYDTLLRILREHPNIIKDSEGISRKSIMEGEDEENLSNHILQLLKIQSAIISKGEMVKPKFNLGSQTGIPNWPVSVTNEGFQPGSVGIDPQYLALLMKTFSSVNYPNSHVQLPIGNAKFNLPQTFGGQSNLPANSALWNYLLMHLGCVLDEQGNYGLNMMPSSNMVGAGQGLVPLNNWLQMAQMPRNGMPNLYHTK